MQFKAPLPPPPMVREVPSDPSNPSNPSLPTGAAVKRPTALASKPSILLTDTNFHKLQELNPEKSTGVIRRISLALNKTYNDDVLKYFPQLKNILPPHLAAFKGDLDSLRVFLNENPKLVNLKMNFSANLLSQKEMYDPLYFPPPQLPKSIRAALRIGNIDHMSLDQRWLLHFAFADSSLLHYACAGDQLKCVEFLIGFGADVNQVNCAQKTPEYYTENDYIRQIFWSIQSEDSPRRVLNRRDSAERIALINNIPQSVPAPPVPTSTGPTHHRLIPPPPISTLTNTIKPQISQHVPPPPTRSLMSNLFDSVVPNYSERPLPPTPLIDKLSTLDSMDDDNSSTTSDRRVSRRLSARRMSRVLSARRLTESIDSTSDISSIPTSSTSHKGRAPPPPPPIKSIPLYQPNIQERKSLVVRKLSVKDGHLESLQLDNAEGKVISQNILSDADLLPTFTNIPIFSSASQHPPLDEWKKNFHDFLFKLEFDRPIDYSTVKKIENEEELKEIKLKQMGNFLTHIKPIQTLANEIISQHAHEEHKKEEHYNKVSNIIKPTILENGMPPMAPSQATLSTNIPDDWNINPEITSKARLKSSNKLEHADFDSMTFTEMVWKRAGLSMNRGLYDKHSEEFYQMRKDAFQRGWTVLLHEFKAYAKRDDWEAISYLREQYQEWRKHLDEAAKLFLKDYNVDEELKKLEERFTSEDYEIFDRHRVKSTHEDLKSSAQRKSEEIDSNQENKADDIILTSSPPILPPPRPPASTLEFASTDPFFKAPPPPQPPGSQKSSLPTPPSGPPMKNTLPPPPPPPPGFLPPATTETNPPQSSGMVIPPPPKRPMYL